MTLGFVSIGIDMYIKAVAALRAAAARQRQRQGIAAAVRNTTGDD
jgi:hypothetical protein